MTPPAIKCRPGAECDRKWSRSLEWVTANSHWRVTRATPSLSATEGPMDTPYPAFTVRRLSGDDGNDRIVFEAGCSPDRVAAVVDHGDRRSGRRTNVSGPRAKLTECLPSVPSLEASFERFVTD